jgi:hypothetical protein
MQLFKFFHKLIEIRLRSHQMAEVAVFPFNHLMAIGAVIYCIILQELHLPQRRITLRCPYGYKITKSINIFTIPQCATFQIEFSSRINMLYYRWHVLW